MTWTDYQPAGRVISNAAATARTASLCCESAELSGALSTATRVVSQIAQHGSSVANLER